MGLVFHAKSPRNVGVDQAAAIVRALPAFVTVVALFRDAGADFVQQVLDAMPVDLLQFHGSEEVGVCESFGRPYIKAVGVEGAVDVHQYVRHYASARGVLLDSHAPGAAGGTGRTFDWNQVPSGLDRPLILAGGLNPDNVAQAIERVSPFAVDVSSGVEASPGIKDANRIHRFMQQVRRQDALRRDKRSL